MRISFSRERVNVNANKMMKRQDIIYMHYGSCTKLAKVAISLRKSSLHWISDMRSMADVKCNEQVELVNLTILYVWLF